MQPPAPSSIQELMAGALADHQAGRLNEAEQLYLQVLRLDPEYVDALHFLGVLSHQRGNHALAVTLIGKAIARNRGVPSFHNNLGNALKAQGELDEAARAYRQAVICLPAYPDAHYNLGLTLQAQGKLQEAADSYRRSLGYRPDHPEAHNSLGNVLQSQGRLEEAVAAYRQALKYRPEYAWAHSNLGTALEALGHLQAAAAAHARALALEPDFAAGYNNLGIVLLKQNKLDEAIAAYARAVQCRPDYPEALNNLGIALRLRGKRPEADAVFRRALELKPDYAESSLGLAVVAVPVLPDNATDSRGAVASFDRALDELQAWDRNHPGLLGRAVGSAQPFDLAYRPADVTAALARYGELICASAAQYWEGRKDTVEIAGRGHRERVRLLIVNGQIRRMHPVWEVVLRGLIAHLDRSKFEVIVYHTSAEADDETEWAQSQVDRFVHGVRSTQGWLAQVARDRPDVIFFPEVGMDTATCALATLRLAPLQIAGWGHPVTTGLPTVDWFVSGELLEGAAAEQHYCEKLIRLPGTGVCTALKPLESAPWPGPGRGSDDVVRFSLCHQPIKFDPADDGLLVQIAQAAAPCEFWLSSPTKLSWTGNRLQERLATAFRAAGLDPAAYLRVTPWMPHQQFAGFMDEMDVYLDCPGFSGYTTAWLAAHRGLPIVTLEGQFLRQRLAAGLLRQIGITDGIANSAQEYVDIATRWARECRHGNRLSARRKALQQGALKADGNLAAVAAFQDAVLEHVSRTRGGA
jgi:predicted O-linked N-acetylglucosamine transferase (SPINDLY family)